MGAQEEVTEPGDHGCLASDLTSATPSSATRTAATQASAAAEQIDVILRRASERGEPAPDAETVIDQVVAPMMYRILFRPDGLDAAYAHRLVAGVLSR
ncbi:MULTISPECIES: TetR-like C-terminal domain-containing protein [unclassified Streptomyces]|uniref:TetR-like C-terminal domain-containing protein n=1 Tax=unclassified Streptomyces TaxID=2593676 RepID=UPI0033B085FA